MAKRFEDMIGHISSKFQKNSSHYTRLWGLAHFVDSTDFDLDAFDEARSFGVCNNV